MRKYQIQAQNITRIAYHTNTENDITIKTVCLSLYEIVKRSVLGGERSEHGSLR